MGGRRAGPAALHSGGGFSGRGRGARGRGRWIRRRDLREEAGGGCGRDDAGRDVRGDADVVHDEVGGREALLPQRHRASRRRRQRVDRDAGLPHPQVAGQAAAQAALARARHGRRRRVRVPGITWNSTFYNASHEACLHCIGESSFDTYKKKQKEKIDPILDWINTEFGFKPVVYTSFFGGKQDEGLAKAVETVLKKTTDCELASIDAMAAAAHSLVIPFAIFRGRLGIEEATKLIRLEEDHQVNRWGLVEGGHDVDIADLKMQMSSAVVFLGLSRGL